MSKPKVKVRSKKEIRKDLMNEIERDGVKRNEIVSMLRTLLNFCEKNDVQPETLLLELNKVNALAVRVCMKKHEEQLVGTLERELSPKEIELVQKDFDRTLGQILKFSQHSKQKGKADGGRPEPVRNAPPPRSNEEMPYKSSNERPYYIH